MPVKKTPASYEVGRLYRITVSRVVIVGPLKITPKHGGTVLGEIAESIKDAIVTSEPAE